MNVFISNTNVITLYRLRSTVDGSFIGDAVVSLTIVDALEGHEVAGEDWPIFMEPVAGSPSQGDYAAVLSDGISFEADTKYIAIVDVDAGVDRIGHWEIPFVAKVRKQ